MAKGHDASNLIGILNVVCCENPPVRLLVAVIGIRFGAYVENKIILPLFVG